MSFEKTFAAAQAIDEEYDGFPSYEDGRRAFVKFARIVRAEMKRELKKANCELTEFDSSNTFEFSGGFRHQNGIEYEFSIDDVRHWPLTPDVALVGMRRKDDDRGMDNVRMNTFSDDLKRNIERCNW
jgi:arginine deiminase